MTAHFALDARAGLKGQGEPVVGNARWPINLCDAMTPRQLEVMLLLCEGMVNKQIAYELDISIATIKVHIRNAITRLGAKNRTNAVAIVAANSAIFRNAAV